MTNSAAAPTATTTFVFECRNLSTYRRVTARRVKAATRDLAFEAFYADQKNAHLLVTAVST